MANKPMVSARGSRNTCPPVASDAPSAVFFVRRRASDRGALDPPRCREAAMRSPKYLIPSYGRGASGATRLHRPLMAGVEPRRSKVTVESRGLSDHFKARDVTGLGQRRVPAPLGVYVRDAV